MAINKVDISLSLGEVRAVMAALQFARVQHYQHGAAVQSPAYNNAAGASSAIFRAVLDYAEKRPCPMSVGAAVRMCCVWENEGYALGKGVA